MWMKLLLKTNKICLREDLSKISESLGHSNLGFECQFIRLSDGILIVILSILTRLFRACGCRLWKLQKSLTITN